MTTSTKQAGLLLVITSLVLSAGAGEPIRFGASQEPSAIQTRPVRSFRETVDIPEQSISFAGGSPAVVAAAPSAPRVRTATRTDEGRDNWIFRDTQSSSGIQRAMGVERTEAEGTEPTRTSSTTEIQDYFERQRPAVQVPGTSADVFGNSLEPSLTGSMASGPFINSSINPSGSAVLSDPVISGDTFKNTLNSDNLAVRRHFRDLYFNQDDQSPGTPGTTAAFAPQLPSIPGLNGQGPGQLSGSLADLAARAAQIESLTPSSPSFAPQTDPTRPARTPTLDLPTENNGTLYERRNGRFEIPSRKF